MTPTENQNPIPFYKQRSFLIALPLLLITIAVFCVWFFLRINSNGGIARCDEAGPQDQYRELVTNSSASKLAQQVFNFKVVHVGDTKEVSLDSKNKVRFCRTKLTVKNETDNKSGDIDDDWKIYLGPSGDTLVAELNDSKTNPFDTS